MSSEAAAGGSTTVIENVEFRATAPMTRLPGLDNAQRKLEALSAAIKQVQSQLAGIGTNSMFKLSPQQFANFAYNSKGELSAGVGQVARRAGFGPEAVKDIRRSANMMVSEVHAAIAKIEHEIARNPGFKAKALAAREEQIQHLKNFLPFRGTKGNPTSSFRGSGAAGMFFGGGLEERIPKLPKGFSFSAPLREILKKGYAGVALANRDRGEGALRAILQGTVQDHGPAVYSPSTMAAAVTQAIKEAKIKPAKTEGGGQKSEVRGQRSEVGKKGQGSGGGKGGEEERVLEPADGPEVERRVEETPNAEDRITTTRRLGPHTTQAALEQEGKVLKLTTRELTEKATAEALRTHLAKLKREYLRDLPLAGNRGTPVTHDEHGVRRGGGYEKLRADYSAAAEKSFAAYGTQHRPMLDQFLHETMPEAEQKEMARAGEQRKKLLKQRYAAEQKDDQVKRANIQAEIDALEDHRKAMGKYHQSGQRATKDIARERKKTAAFTQKQQTQSLFNTVTTQGAMDAEADLQRRGAKLSKENFDMLTGRRTGATYHLTENGWLSKYRVEYNKEGDAVARKVSSLPAVKKNHDRLDQAMEGLTARNMAANMVKVTAWSAAVMVLYKSAELAGYSMRQLVQTSTEMAHLDVVFRGVGGTVQELTTDMLRLAAVEGRATSETMQSAQSWARLGGDRKTINEEVRVSAEAANIANMHMAETSKQLQSLMHIYHLEASDLDSTLGGLVATSLRYNVTLEEMFTGLDRSAAAARVAGISLAELQGMLAVVTGTTGATGSTTGNALKYVFQELNKSEVQQTLRDKYKVETLDSKLNQKPVGQTLGDLSAIWGLQGKRSQQALGGTLGGRFNAARVPVVIEQYPEILKQAIDSQLGLNAAQTANAKILDTVKANMAGLRAEYDRLIMSGNVLARVNLGVAVAKNAMHDTADQFTGPAPSDAEVKAQRADMMARMNAHPIGSQVAALLRLITPDIQSDRTFRAKMGADGRMHMVAEYRKPDFQPGIGDYNALLHDDRGMADLLHPDAANARVDREGKLEDWRRQERAGALRGQSFGIAKKMLGNGTMTDVNANVFAETMRGMGPAGVTNAAAFLKARGSNDTEGAQAAVGRASSQAFNEQHAALDKKQAFLAAEEKDLLAKQKANEDAKAKTMAGGKDPTQAQSVLGDELSRKLAQNRDDVQNLDGAYQELDGTIDTVQITQQKYLDLLKTQEGLLAGIEERFTMVEAHNPAQKLAQQTAMLTAQLAAARQAKDAYDASGDDTTEGKATRARLVDEEKKLQAELAAAKARAPQAALLTAEQHGVTGAENASRAANYGYDETDKLLRVRKELTDDAARVEAQLGRTVAGTAEAEELTGRLAKDNALAYEHTLALARRRADVEAEIHQLAIDQNREFSRSFFGSGAADMLRKLAAFKLALGGGVTQGQLYSMSPAMRQDVGSLTGMNPEMTRLLFERNKVLADGHQLPGFASGGYTGDGNPNEIAGVVHKGEYVLSRQNLSAGGVARKAGYTISRGAVQDSKDWFQRMAIPKGAAGLTLEDLFHRSHDNLFAPGTRLVPGGGIYRPAGIPLDDFGHGMNRIRIPTQERWLGGWSPGDAARQAVAHERSLPAWSPGRGTTTAPWSPRGTSFGQAVNNLPGEGWRSRGWTAARGFISNPKNWAGMGAHLAHGAAGFGVTSGLNWAGGKMGLGSSDTYGGAAYGLFADAAGGATAGARGGPMGMAIGAVGGMAIGSTARLYGGLRDLHRATVGDDKTHQQVSVAQQAMLQRQRERVDAMEVPAPQHRLKFKSHDDDAKARKYAAAMDAADAASRRWHTRSGQPHPIMGSNGKPAAINPATGLPWSSGQNHSIEGRGNIQQPNVGLAATFNAQHPVPGHPASPAPNNAAVMPVPRPAAGGGSAVAANGGDDTAIKNATAALDLLTTTAGKLNTAFAALATRADALFKAQPGRGNGNGLQFQPTGQMGGSYPGKTH